MTLLSVPDWAAIAIVALAIGGAVWGVVADRIAARWPEHDEEEGFFPGRRVGWRTAVVAVFGAVGLGLVPSAVGAVSSDVPPLVVAVFVAYVVALVLLLATDLDQRLMPDLITLPMIVVAFAFAISGQNPFVGGAWPAALAAALVIPAILYVPSLLFGAGAFGLGDVKLLVSVGLMSGAYRAILGTVAGIVVAGIVIVVLLATRRVSLKTYIPFGPFLILGAVWALVLRPG